MSAWAKSPGKLTLLRQQTSDWRVLCVHACHNVHVLAISLGSRPSLFRARFNLLIGDKQSVQEGLEQRLLTIVCFIKALGHAITSIRADCLLHLKPDAITPHSPTQIFGKLRESRTCSNTQCSR